MKGMNYIKKNINWSNSIVISILILLVVLLLRPRLQLKSKTDQVSSFLGHMPMYVLTGSMEPELEPGDMIVAKEVNPEDIKANDVITYRISQDTLVTHRVVEVVLDSDKLYFRTKGDANRFEDDELISQEQLLGILAFNIPKGGYITNFIRSLKGSLVILLLPIILYLAIDIKRMLRKRLIS